MLVGQRTTAVRLSAFVQKVCALLHEGHRRIDQLTNPLRHGHHGTRYTTSVSPTTNVEIT